MLDILTIVTLLAGYTLILVIGAKLGAGPDLLNGLFTYQDMPLDRAASRRPISRHSCSATRGTPPPAPDAWLPRLDSRGRIGPWPMTSRSSRWSSASRP